MQAVSYAAEILLDVKVSSAVYDLTQDRSGDICLCFDNQGCELQHEKQKPMNVNAKKVD